MPVGALEQAGKLSYREPMSESLFDRFRELPLPADDYAIFGSGPLTIRGVIPASNDLDVLCRGKFWEEVQHLGKPEYLPEYDVTIVTLAGAAIGFGTSWGIGEVDVDELIDSAEMIDGLLFARLKYVVHYKTIRNNERDQQHLEALYLSGLFKRDSQS